MANGEHRPVKEIVNDWAEHPYTKALTRFSMLGWTVFGLFAAYFLIPQYLETVKTVNEHSTTLAVIQAERTARRPIFDQLVLDVRQLVTSQATDEQQAADFSRRLDHLEIKR